MDIRYPNEGMPKLPPFKLGPMLIPIAVILLALSALGSLFYQIDAGAVGVVQCFGKYVRTTQPGLHMKMPFGIESVLEIHVQHVYKQEFGYRTVKPGIRTVYTGRDEYLSSQGGDRRRPSSSEPYADESLMLTGDLNVGRVEWIVQYTIKDPVKFAFRIRDPQETIRNMSEAVMRLVVGDHTINEVLTTGREDIQMEVEKKLQELLDSYEAGIFVQNVILQNVRPPKEVEPSFNEVNEARQEKDKVINQAWEEYNRVIPKAKGQAEQIMRQAEGYALERTNRAEGDAQRFSVSWEAYRKSPEVTKRRLYLEMLDNTLPQLKDKLIIDDAQKGILPLLNLNAEKGTKES